MRPETYYRGVPGKKYGIWNCSAKCFQFNIREDTPMLAMARLHQKLGHDAKKWRFEPRMLPDPRREEPTSCDARVEKQNAHFLFTQRNELL